MNLNSFAFCDFNKYNHYAQVIQSVLPEMTGDKLKLYVEFVFDKAFSTGLVIQSDNCAYFNLGIKSSRNNEDFYVLFIPNNRPGARQQWYLYCIGDLHSRAMENYLSEKDRVNAACNFSSFNNPIPVQCYRYKRITSFFCTDSNPDDWKIAQNYVRKAYIYAFQNRYISVDSEHKTYVFNIGKIDCNSDECWYALMTKEANNYLIISFFTDSDYSGEKYEFQDNGVNWLFCQRLPYKYYCEPTHEEYSEKEERRNNFCGDISESEDVLDLSLIISKTNMLVLSYDIDILPDIKLTSSIKTSKHFINSDHKFSFDSFDFSQEYGTAFVRFPSLWDYRIYLQSVINMFSPKIVILVENSVIHNDISQEYTNRTVICSGIGEKSSIVYTSPISDYTTRNVANALCFAEPPTDSDKTVLTTEEGYLLAKYCNSQSITWGLIENAVPRKKGTPVEQMTSCAYLSEIITKYNAIQNPNLTSDHMVVNIQHMNGSINENNFYGGRHEY